MATGSPAATVSVTTSVNAARKASADFLSVSVLSAIAVTRSLRFTETPSGTDWVAGQPCTVDPRNDGFSWGFRDFAPRFRPNCADWTARWPPRSLSPRPHTLAVAK